MIGRIHHQPWTWQAKWEAVVRGLASAADWLWRCRRRAAQRQELLELDARLLRDIGISREDALQEAERPFWR